MEAPYEKLGEKTFWIFVFERIQAPVAFLLMSILFLVLQGTSFLKTTLFGDPSRYLSVAAWGALALCVVTFLLTLLTSWLIYVNYTFCLDEDALKIKRGIFAREEIAIPYRQIQDVDVEQDFSYRAFGVSRLVILTAGHEDEKGQGGDEAEGVLPTIDSVLAERLQSQLLLRANVQTVVEEPKSAA
jgi:uncharacterized membrane protein YdbT with pleckstrin-like domain